MRLTFLTALYRGVNAVCRAGVAIATAFAVAVVSLAAASCLTPPAVAASHSEAVKAPSADPYGYLMVHFLEDSNGYAEKIFLDVTNGDDATSWTPLNGGRAILASDLGASGVRDPVLVRNPETGKYYIIGTDLRVFNEDGARVTDCPSYAPAGYCPWFVYKHLSRDLVVWESDDLVSWSEPRALTVAPPTAGRAWAPEATWVEDYDGRGNGAFVLYWSSTVFNDETHTGPATSDTLYAFTSDFTQSDLDQRNPGGAGLMYRAEVGDVIDTSVHQYKDAAGRLVTYRAYKQNGENAQNPGGITFTSTTATDWWKQDTSWQVLSTKIGEEYGSVEAPLFFQDNTAQKWYMFVDQYGGASQGYRPYSTTDISAGRWTSMGASAMSGMKSNTKHGGVLPLTRAEYDRVRAADVVKATNPARIETEPGVRPTLPGTVTVTTSDGATRAEPVTWDDVDPTVYDADGVVRVRGTVAGGYPSQLNDLASPQTSMEAPPGGWGLRAATPTTVRATIVVGDGGDGLSTLIADFSFNDASTGFSGAGATASVEGTRALGVGADATRAAQLSSGFWLDAKRSDGTPLLAGLDDVTISYDSLPDGTGNTGWAFAAQRSTAMNSFQNEHYLGALDRDGSVTVERYDNAGARVTTGNMVAPGTPTGWKHVDVVISGTSGKLYVDGQLRASNTNGKPLSAIVGAAGGVFQVGKANWGANGEYFAGLVDNLRVHRGALDEAQLALGLEHSRLSIGDTSRVTTNLTLPASTTGGANVTWSSSDASVVSADGQVNAASTPSTVWLTARLTQGAESTTKTFTVQVPARVSDPQQAADRLALPYVLRAGTTLAATIPGAIGATVTWRSSDPSLVSDAGRVLGTADGRGLGSVALTATVSLGGRSVTKQFEVKVSETTPVVAAVYTRAPGKLGSSMHLALSSRDESYRPLNLNQGVLFAKHDHVADPLNAVTKQLVDPYVFRMADGSFGVIATRTNANEAVDSSAAGKALLFTSADLLSFEEVGLVDLGTDGPVRRPAIEYDGLSERYRVTWTGADDSTMGAWTTDFETFTAPETAVAAPVETPDTGVPDADVRGSVVLTRAEGDRLARRYTQVTNTTVDHPMPLRVTSGVAAPTAADLGKVTARYNDGSRADISVQWNPEDLAAVDPATPGEYEVRGTLRTVDHFPLIAPARADPNIFIHEGRYYFVATTENEGQRKLYMYGADTLEGLKNAPANLIQDDGNLAWAPEVHQIDGDWYLNYARGSVWNQVKSTLVRLKDGGIPTRASDWDWANQREVRLSVGGGSPVALQPNGITLDMTYFEAAGTWYAMWSDRLITPRTGSADLKIASFDPADPSVLTSPPVVVARPDYSWDNNTAPVDEGPYALIHDGKLVITFSGSGVDNTYVLGTLTADVGANLLDPRSWTKSNAPILTSSNVAGQPGPGHNAYFVDKDGTLLTAYHANAGGRHSGVRVAHWGAFGNLVVDMTADRQVLPQNRAIVRTVVVEPRVVEPGRVSVSAPVFSRASQVFHATRPASVSAAVAGVKSGTVEFREGSVVVGRAPVVAGRARTLLPATLRVGRHQMTAHLSPTGSSVGARSPVSRVFTVRRTRVTTLALNAAKTFRPGHAFLVQVSIGKLDNGRAPSGKVVVRLGSATLAVISARRLQAKAHQVVVPARLVRGAKLTVRARFVPSSLTTVQPRATSVTITRR